LIHNEAELVLDDEDMRHLSFDEPARLPHAFAAIVRVAAPAGDATHRGDPYVLLDGISGPSGARLLGRFCHVSAAVHDLVNDHLRAEEAQAPDAVFAEIVHLNEGRMGNILCRPVLRDYEIPFLGISGAPRDCQLPITDLLITVRQGHVILRSRRLNRQVIPRLTTAHNFRLRSLGIYRFLGALQNQANDPIGWRWGALAEAPRLPRVRYKHLVFARAQWRLTSQDLAPIVEAVGAESRAAAPEAVEACRADILTAIRHLQVARGLPRFVVLAEGDNELPIDFDNVLSAETFAYTLASSATADHASVILYEQFPSPDDLVVQGPEGTFTHELVIPFVNAEARPSLAIVAAPQTAAIRSFPPGSPWLYAKLYTGQATADRVLREAVAPVVREAMAAGDTDRWFFLRYRDPEHHLRVRFHGEPERLYGTVLPNLHRALSPLMQEGAVWRLQLDTYEREIERYGGALGIDLAEELFWIDSETVLAIVECLDGDMGKDARWRLALRGADLFLDCFGLGHAARKRLFTRASEGFGDEFRVNTALRKQIGHIFRTARADFEVLLGNDLARTREHPLALGFDFLDQGAKRQRPAAAELCARAQQGQLCGDIEDVAWSFVHMHINRLLHASQRAQELVIYDLLKRYHESRRVYAAPRDV
jgi:thiopeptide-type bacteriocin biosynthesis protein